MRILISLILFSASLRAQEAPPVASMTPAPDSPAPERAYLALSGALGEKTVDMLERRGLVLRYGERKGPKGLLHAQWDVLDPVAEKAPALSAFLTAYERLKTGKTGDLSDASSFRALSTLPISSLWTPGARAAYEAVAAHLETATLIGKESLVFLKDPLFKTSWGADFMARVHADQVSDFRPFAELYFDDYIAGFDATQGAALHLSSYVKLVYGKDIDEEIVHDRAAMRISEPLVGWISKYLLDQRRLWALYVTPDRLKALEGGTSLKKDLEDLKAFASAVASAGPSLGSAREFARPSPPEPGPGFSAEKLHVHAPAGTRRFDVGDSASISAAYWVEGLEEGETVSVTEAGFIDDGKGGLSEINAAVRRRKNGGPYAFTATVPLKRAGASVYRFLLGGPGVSPLSLEANIEVSARMPELLARIGEAEALAAECKLEEAEPAFAKALEGVGPSAVKPQFKGLHARLQTRVKAVEKQAAGYRALISSMPGVRLYASKQQCDYRTDRAQKALSDLAALPAGCDKTLGRVAGSTEADEPKLPLSSELHSLFETTQRRRLNQQAFRAALSKAASQESSCKPQEAAQTYAAALALLDSDPQARCGADEKSYAAAKAIDLPRALAAGAILEDVEKRLANAQSLADGRNFSGALEVVNPLIARINDLDGGACYRKQLRQAESLAQSAGASLGPPPAESISSLPKEKEASMRDAPADAPAREPAAEPAANPFGPPVRVAPKAAYEDELPQLNHIRLTPRKLTHRVGGGS